MATPEVGRRLLLSALSACEDESEARRLVSEHVGGSTPQVDAPSLETREVGASAAAPPRNGLRANANAALAACHCRAAVRLSSPQPRR